MTEGVETENWLIVLRPDGSIDSVSGGTPVAWIDHQLAALEDVPESIKRAALELSAVPHRSGCLRRATVRMLDTCVELILVDAIPIRCRETRIADLVMRAVEALAPQARAANVDLAWELNDTVPVTLLLDGEKVAWALSTLVANAVRYAQLDRRHPERGRGRVTVSVAWSLEPAEMVMTVDDNGPGMPQHRARFLFDRDPATSTTLGPALALVNDVVQAHRGSASVASHQGLGTKITIRLPHLSG